MEKIKTIDEAEAQTAASAKLGLKEIRMALGEDYKPIMTVEEAAKVSRLAKKTLQKKVAKGSSKSRSNAVAHCCSGRIGSCRK